MTLMLLARSTCACGAGAAGERVQSDGDVLVRAAEGRRRDRVPRDDPHQRHRAENQVLLGTRRSAAPATLAVLNFHAALRPPTEERILYEYKYICRLDSLVSIESKSNTLLIAGNLEIGRLSTQNCAL